MSDAKDWSSMSDATPYWLPSAPNPQGLFVTPKTVEMHLSSVYRIARGDRSCRARSGDRLP
jgi:hypothetical protein